MIHNCCSRALCHRALRLLRLLLPPVLPSRPPMTTPPPVLFAPAASSIGDEHLGLRRFEGRQEISRFWSTLAREPTFRMYSVLTSLPASLPWTRKSSNLQKLSNGLSCPSRFDSCEFRLVICVYIVPMMISHHVRRDLWRLCFVFARLQGLREECPGVLLPLVSS